MRSLALAALLAVAVPAFALAHGPTPQKVEEKIEIKAEPAKVWALVKDFGGVKAWHPSVESAEVKDGERTLRVKGGAELVESEDENDDASMTLGYRLSNEGGEAFPVSSYSATITVKAREGGSEVTWQGRGYRLDTSNEPPEGKDDASAVKALSEFFKTGLEGLKKKAEAQG
ncbi:SRPBCC family protein [Chelatococcus sambhunathii]|uniref:SRPBCC family protein n=1 Tax=Chelatococcus sambhunathii TaxID=363953 RepID=A0ABU1DGC4_9HYPH|nr:SRPBCC family protein [Chelatococcus sambhunathii]MDR4307170.1 SRPBCC family protein [Chelatococcus sambhunathii]